MQFTESLALLREKIGDQGHPEFPFLHQTYSPTSRIPCTDLTPFIIDRFSHGDLRSVCELMHEILRANPGIGVGPEWIDYVIEEVYRLRFSDYIAIEDENLELELKAFFVVASKDGSDREFWLSDQRPHLISLMISCHRPRFFNSMNELVKRANVFIRRMKEDAPFWADYPEFHPDCWKKCELELSSVENVVRQLSIGARLQLMTFVPGESGSLEMSTTFAIRSLGIDVEKTTLELIKTGFFVSAPPMTTILDALEKVELQQLCRNSNTDYKKSWSKGMLLTALMENAPETLSNEVSRRRLVTLDPTHRDALHCMLANSQKLEPASSLISFI